MSEVYKATDLSTGQVVVVKIPHANLIGDPAAFSRYQREMEIGKRLAHPNIQHLIEEGRLGGGRAPYMVLEYVEGTPLREYLSEHAPLPEAEALDLAGQIADAIGYCHGLGIVHRDLKPENMLLTTDGKVKLLDFGIALLRGARRLTYRRLSNSIGTPDYMAPEQVEGDRGDARTDIYAIGVMLYEMLAGEVPFQGDNPLVVMSQRVMHGPPLLRKARPDVAPQVEAIVFKALRRNPADRYQSVEELLHDLRHPETVAIPNYAVLEPPGRLGGMPPVLRTVGLVAAIFAVLTLLGVLAELAHRSQIGR